jgi:hypothetical protein
MRARATVQAKDQFQNQYSSLLSSLTTRTITSTISGVIHTRLGPRHDRVQLLLSSLAISKAPYDCASSIRPIHEVGEIKAFLDQLQQLHQPAVTPAPVENAVAPTVSVEDTNVEMTESLPDHVQAAERSTPLKRPHSQSSPNPSSSHRLVRPRIHNDDEDVIVQTGLNLNQPIQLQPSNSLERSRQLSLLLNKGPSVRASTSTDREQALRLASLMAAQMAPPPIPAIRNSDSQAQAPSQADLQFLSQSFESQIPLAEVQVPEQAAGGALPKSTAGAQLEPKDITLPKINMPSNTPTSAQPEPLEVTQSSLPRISSQRVPVPSQSEALVASLGTSSSHLLDETSSGTSRPMHRAPSAQFIRYARRPIPKNQRNLLDKPSSWWPARPGTTFTHPNIPVEDLNKIEKAAELRVAKAKGKDRDELMEEGNERELTRLSNTQPATQGTQSSGIPWSPSPEHHTEPRYCDDTLRRSTNIVEPESPDDSPPAKLPLIKLLPDEYPPDSSADLMQVDKPEEDEPVDQIPSSPPTNSVSDGSSDSDIGSPAPPARNVRQLPEFPMGSPEETSPRSSPQIQPSNPELKSSLLRSASHDGSRGKDDDLASFPILEVPASPQPHETIEDLTEHSRTLDHDGPSIQLGLSNNALLTSDQHQAAAADDDDDDDVVMDDQPQVDTDQVVDKQPQTIVIGPPKSRSRKERISDWGLTESAETGSQKRARHIREFLERASAPNTNVSATLVPQATAQLDDEDEKSPELPVANTEPQPDPMEVGESHAASTKSLDPNATSRAHMINQWRQQSGQEHDRSVAASESEPLESAVSDLVPAESVVPEATASRLPLSDAARPFGLYPPEPPHTDRQSLDGSSVNSLPPLPPRPSYRSDMHTRDASFQIRQEIERGKFGEPTRALWVGSLPASINNTELRQIFAEFNPISASAKQKFGFVNFTDVDAACRALEAKHNSFYNRQNIVCNFAVPQGPALIRNTPSGSDRPVVSASRTSHNAAKATPSLTIDDLFCQLVEKRNFEGNKTAFETLCRNLHMSSDIPPSQWDDYVVFQPALFLPWASQTLINGGQILDYNTYWHQTLQKISKPDLVPVLTPAKLAAVFNRAPVVKVPSTGSSAPVSPQTNPGVRRPRPPPPPVHRTPAPASPLAHSPATDDLRRSVVERNAQSTASTPQKAKPMQPHPLLNLPDPLRTSKWIRQNFIKDPNGKVTQQELYNMYKTEFAGTTVPLMPGGIFVKHVFNTYPGHTVSETDHKGNKTFYCTGLRHKFPPRPPPTDDATPEFKIKGVSASSSTRKNARDEHLHESCASPGERGGRSSRRSLPFREEQQQLSRSRSPPRNPPARAPKGKPPSPDHLLIHEVSHFSF